MKGQAIVKVEGIDINMSVSEAEELLDYISSRKTLSKSNTPTFKLGRCIAEALYPDHPGDRPKPMRTSGYNKELPCKFKKEGCDVVYKKESFLKKHEEKCKFNPDKK